MTFREKLVELRAASGMTQGQLAEKSGVPLATLRKYEQDQRGKRVTLGVASRLATALGVTCEEFAACVDVKEEDEEPADTAKAKKPKK